MLKCPSGAVRLIFNLSCRLRRNNVRFTYNKILRIVYNKRLKLRRNYNFISRSNCYLPGIVKYFELKSATKDRLIIVFQRKQ